MTELRHSLRSLRAWIHPDTREIDSYLCEAWDRQAVLGLKLIGTVLIALALFSRVILVLIPTSASHGTVISIKFSLIGALLLAAAFIPALKKINRWILLAVMLYLITDNLYAQLSLFASHKTQLGLFIASICFIMFTFLPYRPWVIAIFGLFGVLAIIIFCERLGIVINPRYNTNTFWLVLQFSALGLVTIFFRAAILNLQINIYESDIQDIKRLLGKTESQNLEFKSSLRWDYHQNKINPALELAALKSIAGFLNSSGGALILGVDDKGSVVGLEQDMATLKKKDADGFELALVQLVSQSMGPGVCQNLRFSFSPVEEHTICLVRIKPYYKPVYVDRDRESVFYIRTGNATQSLDTRKAIEYIKEHWHRA